MVFASSDLTIILLLSLSASLLTQFSAKFKFLQDRVGGFGFSTLLIITFAVSFLALEDLNLKVASFSFGSNFTIPNTFLLLMILVTKLANLLSDKNSIGLVVDKNKQHIFYSLFLLQTSILIFFFIVKDLLRSFIVFELYFMIKTLLILYSNNGFDLNKELKNRVFFIIGITLLFFQNLIPFDSRGALGALVLTYAVFKISSLSKSPLRFSNLDSISADNLVIISFILQNINNFNQTVLSQYWWTLLIVSISCFYSIRSINCDKLSSSISYLSKAYIFIPICLIIWQENGLGITILLYLLAILLGDFLLNATLIFLDTRYGVEDFKNYNKRKDKLLIVVLMLMAVILMPIPFNLKFIANWSLFTISQTPSTDYLKPLLLVAIATNYLFANFLIFRFCKFRAMAKNR